MNLTLFIPSKEYTAAGERWAEMLRLPVVTDAAELSPDRLHLQTDEGAFPWFRESCRCEGISPT